MAIAPRYSSLVTWHRKIMFYYKNETFYIVLQLTLNVIIPGLLLYFLYGIHHSKLGEGVTGLLSRSASGGGHSGGWGAVEKTSAIARRVGRFARGSKGDDRKPIISDDDLSRREP